MPTVIDYRQQNGAGGAMYLTPLTFAPLPFATHPIDTANQPQGFGPFSGPWQPEDYRGAKDVSAGGELNITWYATSASSPMTVAPSTVLTIAQDRSLQSARNANPPMQTVGEGRTSTFGNAGRSALIGAPGSGAQGTLAAIVSALRKG